MKQRTVMRGVLIGSGLIAAVLVAGCQGGSSAGGSPTSSLDVSPTTSPTTTIAPSTPAGASVPTTAVGSGSGGTAECKAAGLKLSIGQGDAAAGHSYLPIEFTNTGSSTCVMRGWPGVSYVTGDNGTQVGQPAARTGTIGSSVTLAPGATASSIVTVTDVAVFGDGSPCQPTPIRGFRVYAPDDTASLFIAKSGEGCAGNPPSPQLQVETVKAGAGSA
ncbi:MAG TPA: DUF4232 domain-containing protein [Pseudonocardiaceae bacterium]|jgi:hypothetical protein|nr:DUF4232 domain-containing protein [Pseudonocardiaceae bacterium]